MASAPPRRPALLEWRLRRSFYRQVDVAGLAVSRDAIKLQSMSRQLFGTDGVRGRANSEPMTAEIAMRISMAAGRIFNRGDHRHRRRHRQGHAAFRAT